MIFRQLFDSETSTYTYVLGDDDTREAVIIDPVATQVSRDLALLRELNLHLLYALDTHVHADHITGLGELRDRAGAKCVVGAKGNVNGADINVSSGDRLSFGAFAIEVYETPGHTLSCITYVVANKKRTFAFTGDALLIRGCGRTDFQQGDAKNLFRSVHEHIFCLPDDTVVFPGHDYHGHTSSTVAEEKAHNPRLHLGIGEEEFCGIMENLNLAPPNQIRSAVAANLNCGKKV